MLSLEIRYLNFVFFNSMPPAAFFDSQSGRGFYLNAFHLDQRVNEDASFEIFGSFVQAEPILCLVADWVHSSGRIGAVRMKAAGSAEAVMVSFSDSTADDSSTLSALSRSRSSRDASPCSDAQYREKAVAPQFCSAIPSIFPRHLRGNHTKFVPNNWGGATLRGPVGILMRQPAAIASGIFTAVCNCVMKRAFANRLGIGNGAI